ncbi:MAG TPA: TylF/MycF/NovP-related O-methyltransferase [Caulobacteraceae bacterium]
MNVRSALASVVNGCLNRLGYALVRLDGDHIHTTFASHLGVQYAYQNIVITDAFAPWAIDTEFVSIWNRIRANTLVDIYRCYELYQLGRDVAHIQGDVLEVGVWRGGTGALLAAAANRWKPGARVWLCDTFEGVVKAGEHDPAYEGGEHSDTSKETVEALTSELGLDNVVVLAGAFPDETASAVNDRQIALCHVDVDVYQSASEIVSWAYPRMPSGAILVFDDYGFSTCKGVTRLVEELKMNGEWRFLYNLNKHAVLTKR